MQQYWEFIVSKCSHMATNLCDTTKHTPYNTHTVCWRLVLFSYVAVGFIFNSPPPPPIRHQAIIWTNAGLLSIGALGTNFSEILIKKQKLFAEINASENIVCGMAAILSRERWVIGLFAVTEAILWLARQIRRRVSQYLTTTIVCIFLGT